MADAVAEGVAVEEGVDPERDATGGFGEERVVAVATVAGDDEVARSA